VFCEKVVIDARLVVKALQETGRDQLDEVVIALDRFAQQHKVIAAARSGLTFATIPPIAPGRFFAAVQAAALGDVHFATDDGLDVALARLIEKISRRKEIAVVSDGHGRHFLAGRLIEQFGSFASSIEQAEIRMHMEMNKLRLAHGPQF